MTLLLLASWSFVREGLHPRSAWPRGHVVHRGVRCGLIRVFLHDGLVARGDEPPVWAAGDGGHASHAQPCAEEFKPTATATAIVCAAVGGGCDRYTRADDVDDSLFIKRANVVSDFVRARAERVNYLDWRGATRRMIFVAMRTCSHAVSFDVALEAALKYHMFLRARKERPIK